MVEEEKILFANEAFYAAFAGADLDAMKEIWAADVPVSVVHPGDGVIHGREAVLTSWSAILEGVKSFDIRFRDARARCFGQTGMVVCYESVGGHNLIATNLFALRDGSWRMVHHQSGACPVQPPEKTPRPTVVH